MDSFCGSVLTLLVLVVVAILLIAHSAIMVVRLLARLHAAWRLA